MTQAQPVGTETAQFPRFTVALVCLVFVMSTQAFLGQLGSSTPDDSDGDPAVQLIWIGIYGACGVLLVFNNFRRLPIQFEMAALGCLAIVSAFWSIAPELSLRRGVALCLTLLAAAFSAYQLSLREWILVIRWSLIVLAVASLSLLMLWPAEALDPLLGTLRGVFYQKNSLGRVMALGVVIEALVFILWRRKRWSHISAAVLYGVCLGASVSATGAFVAAITVILILLAKSDRKYRLPWAVLVLVLGCVLVLIADDQGTAILSIFELVGKDPTLSNRTDVWGVVLQFANERPVGGWGFGAFWSSAPGAPQNVIQEYFNYAFVHSHNGFLDVYAQLGLAGLVLVLSIFLVLLWRASVIGKRGDHSVRLVMIGLLAFVILYNFTESPLVGQNQMTTLVLGYAAFLSVKPQVSEQDPVQS